MSWRERLSADHRQMLLQESSISGRVLVQRGYRTVESKAELERLGFGRSQRNTPALLVPIYSPDGEVVLYQSRPDSPRIKRGKPVKYETPAGSRMVLDVHPLCRKRIADPSAPLFVTEGIKKVDALVSRGLCAVALIGVWNWRGTNEHGGKTALAEWERVALNDRTVYIVFDSDVMEKREVYAALSRLKRFLEHRGAKARLVYLPGGEGAAKQGVDDYLAAGHTVDELLSHVSAELREPPREEGSSLPYRATPAGLVWDKPTQNGMVPTPLCNFTARIVADIAEDDGAEVRRRFELEARLKDRSYRFSVPSGQFAGMGWATEHVGAGAIVYPGFGAKDHARAAVQLLSGDVPEEHVYAHTGWREIGEEWVYLHAGGAIGRVGRVKDVRTELTGGLGGRMLPDPPEGDELKEAVRSSLHLLRLAPARITATLLAATYRAPLGETDFGIHISGPTGEGKSELAALSRQHYGSGLDSRTLLSWESTENAIEGITFQAKDQIEVLDDFAPTGTSYDVQRWHKKADRVFRAKGNASGRQRMRADTTLRPDKPPRALLVSTGEDIPRGQSLRARLAIMELSPGELEWPRLSGCQRDASGGRYAAAMSGYVRWLASQHEEIRAGMTRERTALREIAGSSLQHRRTPGIVADLALGLRYMLRFAVDVGAVDEARAQELWAWGWQALGEAAAAQQEHQAAGDPTRRFGELLSAAIVSGRAHVAGPDGEEPSKPGLWGWRRATVGTGDFEREEWRPQGQRIGWIDGQDLYLEPEASFAAAQGQGRDSGDALTVTSRTLRKRLHERGLLISTDEARQVLTVRRNLGGSRRSVLHTADDFLSPHTDQPDQPDHGRSEADRYRLSVPPLWSGSEDTTRPTPDQEPDHQRNEGSSGRVSEEAWSGQDRQPDHGPDQRKAYKQVESGTNGRVGRVNVNSEDNKEREVFVI